MPLLLSRRCPLFSFTFNSATHPRLLILNLRVPLSASAARESLPLLTLATNLLDALEFSHIKLTEKALAKIRKSRTDFERDLAKEGERERKEEEEEARLKKKKEEEEKKLEGLSAKEQAKRKEVEEKRARRKAQGKMKARG